MELSFATAVLVFTLTVAANLGGEVVSEVFGQYIAASYEDYLWSGQVPPPQPEPDITTQATMPPEEFHGLIDVMTADRTAVKIGGAP